MPRPPEIISGHGQASGCPRKGTKRLDDDDAMAGSAPARVLPVTDRRIGAGACAGCVAVRVSGCVRCAASRTPRAGRDDGVGARRPWLLKTAATAASRTSESGAPSRWPSDPELAFETEPPSESQRQFRRSAGAPGPVVLGTDGAGSGGPSGLAMGRACTDYENSAAE